MWKHRNKREPLCDLCRPLWNEYMQAQKANTPGAQHRAVRPLEQKKYDALLAKHPPKITWRRKASGVWVAVSVRDPHAEATHEAVEERLRFAELEQERLEAMEDEARRVAEQREQERADNTPLIYAARRSI